MHRLFAKTVVAAIVFVTVPSAVVNAEQARPIGGHQIAGGTDPDGSTSILTLCPDIDAYVDEREPSSPHASGLRVAVGLYEQPVGRQLEDFDAETLLRFNLRPLRPSTRIIRATLEASLVLGPPPRMDPPTLPIYVSESTSADWDGRVTFEMSGWQPSTNRTQSTVVSLGQTHVSWDVTSIVQEWWRDSRARGSLTVGAEFLVGARLGRLWFGTNESGRPACLVVVAVVPPTSPASGPSVPQN